MSQHMTDDWKHRKLSASVKRLGITITSRNAIPPGGGLADGVEFLLDRSRFIKGIEEGVRQAFIAIDAVRAAAEPNPWKNSSDEEIAAEILRQAAEKKKANT